MKEFPARWATALLLIAFVLLPIASAAAADGGTLYLPMVAKNTPVPTPVPDGVEQVGPFGGTFTAVAIDPDYINNTTLYVGTFGHGVQKSVDGGLSWQAANNGLGNLKIQALTIRSSDGALFAGTYGSGIYRSTDGGANWQAVNNPADGILPVLIVYDIEIVPNHPEMVFLSGRTPGACADPLCDLYGYIYKSTDGGSTWGIAWNSRNSFNNGDYSYDVEVDPNNPLNVYFTAHRNGVYRSVNGGATWLVTDDVNDRTARKLLVISDPQGMVYQSLYDIDGVYKTTDSGGTWTADRSGLPSPLYGFALGRDSANSNSLYLGTGDRGVYKSSTDLSGPASWAQFGLESNFIWAFGMVPGSSPALYAATGGNGLQYSADGSANWQPRNAGILNTTVTALMMYNGALYAGVNGGGVYRSTDQGATWQAVNGGLTNLNVQNLQVIHGKLYAFTTTSLYVSADGFGWSIAFTQWLGPATGSDGFAGLFSERSPLPAEEQFLMQPPVTEEKMAHVPQPAAFLRQITAASANGTDLWAGTAGTGLYLYKTNGFSYCDFSGRTIFALHSSQASGALYASLTGLTPGTYAVVKWKSVQNDACGDWDTVNEYFPKFGTVTVNNFASNAARTFALTSAGIYYTTGHVITWYESVGISGAVYSLATDPTNANLVYAAAESGAYLSVDGGVNWSPAPKAELQNRPFLSVQVDGANPNIVYFGSRDGSTYRWDKTLP